MADDYSYHVFLSYRRQPDIANWVKDVFGPKLAFYLGEALGGVEASIFWDKEDLAPGDIWWKRIETALRGSSCVVPIWSPSYFRSAYCVAEWLTFRQRGFDEGLTDWGLVVPVVFNDGRTFPPGALSVQYEDLNDFAYDGIQRTADPYIRFQQRLRTFAEALAIKVQQAPAFKATFGVVAPSAIEQRTIQDIPLEQYYLAGAPRIGRVLLAA